MLLQFIPVRRMHPHQQRRKVIAFAAGFLRSFLTFDGDLVEVERPRGAGTTLRCMYLYVKFHR
jgi:hypothetical protein